MPRENWNRADCLLALRLYMLTPFGQLHARDPDVIRLAERLNRTPGAVAMKASNFASLDPELARTGLKNAGRAAEELWAEYEANPTAIILEADELASRDAHEPLSSDVEPRPPSGPSESEATVKSRRLQSFFRQSVMVSYEGRCALTGLATPELLVASHIIPWAADESRRADPTNGILLSALLDRAFDRGLLTFDDDYRAVVAARLMADAGAADLDCSLRAIQGRPLRLPRRFPPDRRALAWHRNGSSVCSGVELSRQLPAWSGPDR